MSDSKSPIVLILVGAMVSASTLAEDVPSPAGHALAALSEEGVDNLAPKGDRAGEVRGGDPPPGCEPGAGDCYVPNGSPGCEDIDCCTEVCLLDSFCCLYDWDAACAEIAWKVCDPPTGIGACCDEDNDCIGVTPEVDCDGSWYEGWNCGQIVCSDAALDLCPGEVIEIGSSVTGSTIVATVDSGFPFCGTSITAPGVWYTVIGNGHTITATTCNSFTDYDSKISVYCSSCAEPTCVGGNDDAPGAPPECDLDGLNRKSIVTWCSEVGGEYYILVHGFSSEIGDFQLDIIDEGTCTDPAPGCLPPIGACCQGLTCTGNTEPGACDGVWYPGEDCDTFECPTGACCNSLDCTDTVPADECDGEWYRDEACPGFACPFGACCDGLECTETTAESDCIDAWYAGMTCPEFDCVTAAYCDACYSNCGPGVDPCPADTAGIPDDWITNVTFNTINNDTLAEGCPCSYGDYTSISTFVTPSTTHTLTVSVCSEDFWVQHVRAWFDWNRNGEFEAGESYYLGSGIDATLSLPINIPPDAAPGCTRLRVIEEWSIDPGPNGDCTNDTYGETEDYTVCIGEPPECGNGECEPPLETCDDCPGDCKECYCGNGTCDSDEDCATCEEDCGACAQGACCDGFECIGTMIEPKCPYTWIEGENCATFQCPFGACCAGTDCTGNTPPESCSDDWYVGEDCATFDCPESNDHCPGIPLLVPDSIQDTTVDATPDTEYPECGTSITTNGVWFSVVGNGHTITATTCNAFTDYDSKISVYCSSCVDPTCVGGNDDSCSGFSALNSTVTWCSESGSIYYILVHGFSTATGNFKLDILDQGVCGDPAPGCTPPVGACCDGLTCTGNTGPDECDGAWYGAEDCGTFECPSGACCDYENVCTGTMGESDCSEQWYMNQDCATFDCPEGEYCEPCYSDCGPGVDPCPDDLSGAPDDWITNVTFNTINHDTLGEGCSCSYGDYSTLSTSVNPGETYSLTVSFCSEAFWTEHARAWIDWDRDYVFEDSESYYLGSGVDATLSIDITIPMDAAPGCTRMRVKEKYSTDTMDPCEVYTWGEAEDYTVCVEASCPAGEVTYLDPPDNVVDAGMPSDVNGGPLLGIDQIRVAAPAGVAASCFTLCENDDGGLGPNSIVGLTDNGDGIYTIQLSRPLTPLAVTTITYTGSNATGRWTTHPANANGDSGAGPIDILSVIDYLNGVDDPPHGLYSVDVNRSGVAEASDILAVIDLLNGAGVFPVYLDTSLPVNTECP